MVPLSPNEQGSEAIFPIEATTADWMPIVYQWTDIEFGQFLQPLATPRFFVISMTLNMKMSPRGDVGHSSTNWHQLSVCPKFLLSLQNGGWEEHTGAVAFTRVQHSKEKDILSWSSFQLSGVLQIAPNRGARITAKYVQEGNSVVRVENGSFMRLVTYP